jgi:two-component system chemotaxis response regulator CheB
MDIEMPEMNGLEAVKVIMKESPTPIIMLSSMTKEGADATFIALEYGAIDFIAKPSGTISLDLHKIKEEIIEKVLAAAHVSQNHFNKHDRSVPIFIENHKVVPTPVSIQKSRPWDHQNPKLICIGTSTGGPKALQQVLTALPKDIDAPLLIVQHMPPAFTKSLADRLNSLSQIHIKEAADGEKIEKGNAYIAPGGFHMTVSPGGKDLYIKLNTDALRNGHRPAVDVLFESVSEIKDFDKITVIMTGMGADGTKGLVKLKETGNVRAIAESQESCIVFGMPKAAIATHLIDQVAHLRNISSSIMNYLL